ncbi:hypothetical protein [Streptomyces ficellus]|uniref:Uncharacterized protein n=1 Tax=Streptomyces ficellus TaxID=1977088 RepID=A0A6I6F774_9ACTN|nr:hypothetical protein [Streptomyces ficellus]QGV78811.1 hypothetical protein EIZ62_11545 [Streptomyces ficellus]
MTATGTPFDVSAVLAAVDDLLGMSVPSSGPTAWEPGQAEGWSASHGDGFRLRLLWKSRAYTEVPGSERDAAREEAAEYLAALKETLDERWGEHRVVGMGAFARGEVDEESVPPLFDELRTFALYEDLLVWGPVGSDHGPRWVAVTVGQCDEGAPHLMVAGVSAVPIEELPGG